MSFSLIVTQPFDVHAIFVSAVLDQLDHRNEVVISDSILRDGGFSFSLGEEQRLIVRDQDIDVRLTDITSLWNRRRLVTPYPPEDAAPVDMPFLESAAFTFSKSIHTLSEECFAVNSSTGVMRSSDKARQLRSARRHGLKVPDTIISNDYDRVAEFAARHGKICVKAFHNANWRNEEGLFAAFTAIIDDIAVHDRRSIEIAPMIYQEFIPKAFELRVTIFGNYCGASKINSTRSDDDQLDWRMGKAVFHELEDYALPDEVFQKLRMIMSDLGIRFGSFDLAYNSDMGWVFFEVNESGQFLWQEQYCPDTILLEPFSRFLVSEDDDFTFDRSTASTELSMGTLRPITRDLRMYRRVAEMGLLPPGASDVWDERNFPAAPSEVSPEAEPVTT